MTRYLAIGCGVLVLLLGISGWLLKMSYEERGALQTKLASANAVIAQREADMKLSALVIAKLQGRVDQIDSQAAPIRERIIHVPVTTSCGPAIAAAVAGVRDLLANPDRPPAGRLTTSPVRPASPAAPKPN